MQSDAVGALCDKVQWEQESTMATQFAQPWQQEPDIQALRASLHSQIYRLFQLRRPSLQNQWTDKLPDFVKRLEDALFKSARSKEDYVNMQTLESRLQDVARRLVHQRPATGQQQQGVFPAPGTPQLNGTVAAGMMPQAGQPVDAQAFHAAAGQPQQPGQQQEPGLQPQQLQQQHMQQQQQPGASSSGTPPLPNPHMLPQHDPAYPMAGMNGLIPNPTSGAMQFGASSSGANAAADGAAGLDPTFAGLKFDDDAGVKSEPGMKYEPVVKYEQPGGLKYEQGPKYEPGLGFDQGGMMGGPMGGAAGGMAGTSGMQGMGGMVPMDGMGSAMGPGSSYAQASQQQQQPLPSSTGGMGLGGYTGSPALIMSNGVPALRKSADPWSSAPSASMVPMNGGMSMQGNLGMNGMVPAQLGGGMVPTGNNSPSLMIPNGNAGGMGGMGGMGNGMVPVQNNGMMPVPGMVPVKNDFMASANGPVGPGMVPIGNAMNGGMNGGMNMMHMGGNGGMNGGMGMNMSGMPSFMQPVPGSMQQQGGQQNMGSMSGLMPSGAVSGGGMMPDGSMGDGSAATGQQVQQQRQQYIQKQQRWLLFLRHCAKCNQDEQECQFSRSCRVGKELWQHILTCSNSGCTYPRCVSSKDLLKHHQKCQNAACPICTPVKEYVRRTRNQSSTGGSMGAGGQLTNNYGNMGGDSGALGLGDGQMGGLQMSTRSQTAQLTGQKRGAGSMQQGNGMDAAAAAAVAAQGPGMRIMPAGNSTLAGGAQGGMVHGMGMHPGSSNGMLMVPNGMVPGGSGMGVEDERNMKRIRPDVQDILSKNTGTSLLETFDEPTIHSHVELIRTAAAQVRLNNPPPLNPDDACRVCHQTKLTFEPPCLYCTQCGTRIKRGQVFHCTPVEYEIKGFWCHGCCNSHQSDRVPFEGSQTGFVRKVELVKKKNDDEIEEGWVQCDACEGWVHQICGLFNKGRNDKNKHYLCPDCLVQGLRSGRRERILSRPQAMLEAKDLPQCHLSRHLQGRLNAALEHEAQQRAMQTGRPMSEVPTADSLTIRVINNVMKKCEVKPKFHEAFGSEGYPEAFMYRQKVVVLFQSIDGVDVALYCMYVQEYGADCALPNRKCVYLSYIDSIKYFRPEVQAAVPGNVSLRTYVYHQILLGYLQWVRVLGFEQMFIWACPPLQGDDYILYCHPSRQKTPRSDRLRAWYHDMLRRAREEGNVAHVSTLWDSFFDGGRESRPAVEGGRCSAMQIPYLDGDYWPGEAENLLANIQDGVRGGGKGGASSSNALAVRKGGNKGKRYGPGCATTDEQLMSRLGDVLSGNMKEDFMVVHLREPCSLCGCHITGGALHRYLPPPSGMPQLKPPPERKFEGIRLEAPGAGPSPSGPLAHFQVCENCFTEEAARMANGAKGRLPPGLSLTDLALVPVQPVQIRADPDADLESEFFETRQAFLSLCQGNHYQFDSLRRAKHSSMMVLYHLHNPSAPAFTSTCNACSSEIEAGSGYRCTQCQDFDLCGACYQRNVHEHPMVPHVNRQVDETRTRLTEQERLERQQQAARTMQLMVHACSCQSANCGSSSCRKVRALFQHSVMCPLKITGGCNMCKKMWLLLTMHAKSCTDPECPVPRCKELKDLRRRQTARLEKHRRIAYQNMMRSQMQPMAAGKGGE